MRLPVPAPKRPRALSVAPLLLVPLFAGSASLSSALLHQPPPQTAAPPAAAQEPAPPAKPATGPELFANSGCQHCHTLDGTGGDRGPNLSGIGRRWKNERIRHQVQEGGGEMPAYKDVLSEAEITTLVDYLHTRRAKEPEPPPAKISPPAPPAPPAASDPT